MVDPKPIGAGQTSACGTFLGVIEAMGLHDSLRQVHSSVVLHTPHQDLVYHLDHPFCTFDYADFCTLLAERTNVDILQASVLGIDGNTVMTSQGEYRTRCAIDASGWRAVLTPEGAKTYRSQEGMSFGLETTLPYQEDGLHFWYEPDRLLPFGVTWLFPAGPVSRLGIASYQGETALRTKLTEWLSSDFDLSPDGFHGGYLPYTFQTPIAGRVFRAGDAAGHCLPMTGEGIRQALYFGLAAGRLARRALNDELSLTQALSLYNNFVLEHRTYYSMLLNLQNWLTHLPVRWTEAAVRLINWPQVLNPALQVYWKAFNPAVLAPTPKEIKRKQWQQQFPQRERYQLAV
jgi:flavin-dependent dehydrogenase